MAEASITEVFMSCQGRFYDKDSSGHSKSRKSACIAKHPYGQHFSLHRVKTCNDALWNMLMVNTAMRSQPLVHSEKEGPQLQVWAIIQQKPGPHAEASIHVK